MLTDKTIVLGITGSIAAYKAAEIASKLTEAGAKVEVVMTESATKFIAPLTLRCITRRPVVTNMFDLAFEWSAAHIALAETADVVLIAPATANIMAKLAAGIADDMLCCTVLATEAPVVVAPAMNVNMFENSITQDNLAKLKARGFTIVDPAYGRLASGKIGLGRLAEVEQIIGTVKQVLGKSGDLAGKRIVVTAGGTQEPIDPARHIGNRSSGKMGYAVAEAARDRGATVSLVTAPTSLSEPAGIKVMRIRTAVEMKEAVARAVAQADALIMAAAVADYQPKDVAETKIKKEAPSLPLELIRTPDILTEVKGNFIKVGFAAESEDIIANARQKLKKKQLDIIIANDITDADSGFGVDTNKVTLIDRSGKVDSLPLLTKREVADKILDRVVELLSEPKFPSIQIEVIRSALDYYIIPIHSEHRLLFPGYDEPFTLITDIDEVTTHVTGAPQGTFVGDPYAGNRIQGNLWRWYRKHRELSVGDKLLIEIIEPHKRYRLQIVND